MTRRSMRDPQHQLSRRRMLAWSAGAGAALALGCAQSKGNGSVLSGGAGPASGGSTHTGGTANGGASHGGAGGAAPVKPPIVALVRAESYDDPVVHGALSQAFDLIGGIRTLVQGKTVSIKVNLTGGSFDPVLGHTAAETYVTHGATVLALVSLLFDNGATRVRIIESLPSRSSFTNALVNAGWDVTSLTALGNVEFENTRNLGLASSYSHLVVPGAPLLYSSFELNHSYVDTDVLISLAKLKNHAVAGVTLSLKNLFGSTPLPLYGTQTDLGEDALGSRQPMHDRNQPDAAPAPCPGEIAGYEDQGPGFRVPRIVTDLNAARPVDLAIVEGITAVTGGEGPWSPLYRYVEPHVLIVGRNAVSTDAVAVATMGYPDPLAASGSAPFPGDNHIALAQHAGLGTANLREIEIVGLSLVDAITPYA